LHQYISLLTINTISLKQLCYTFTVISFTLPQLRYNFLHFLTSLLPSILWTVS